jgi:hypothetical protein
MARVWAATSGGRAAVVLFRIAAVPRFVVADANVA